MRFLSVSLGLLVPVVGPAGVIPATTPLVQLNVVPAVDDVGLYVTTVLLQISAIVKGLVRTGVGFTRIVKVCEGPGQSTEPLLNDGVTVIVALIAAEPVLVAVKERLPVPSVPNPIAVLVLVQLKVVNPPVLAVVNTIFCADPLQITISGGSLTCPSGFTVMVNVLGVPEQLVPPLLKTGVTVIVPVMGEVTVFAAVNEIFPEPVAGKPMPVLLLVQL